MEIKCGAIGDGCKDCPEQHDCDIEAGKAWIEKQGAWQSKEAIGVLNSEKACVARKTKTNCCDCANCDLVLPDDTVIRTLDFAIETMQKVEDGLMVELPCKAGTPVYYLCWIKSEECDEQCPVEIDDVPQCGMCDYGVWGIREVPFALSMLDEMGKTVFLTLEAANEAKEP
jgi:hypothetical protein